MSQLEQRPLTLQDVALLARVRRAVVTTWRHRHLQSPHPFPDAVAWSTGQEMFDCEQVVSWLETTGRGNNPAPHDDAIAFTLTAAQVATDAGAFAGLSALLCLRVLRGPLPGADDELLDRAEVFDADDEVLFSEVAALGPRLQPLARYADLLVASAFDPADPFDQLIRSRAAQDRSRALHPTLRRLLARAALAVADQAGFVDPVLVVRTVDDVDLLIEAAGFDESRGALRTAVVLPAGDTFSTETRLVRRWLRVHDIASVEIADDGEGRYELPDQGIALVRLHAGESGRLADLDDLTNLALNLSPRQRGLVVGAAATLTAPLRKARRPGRPSGEDADLSEAGIVRSDALKTGAVRAVVRLPRGLLPHQPRAQAALWCLGPPTRTPAVTLCGRIDRTLTDEGADDLVTDLVVALQGPSGVRGDRSHHAGSAVFRATSDLIVTTEDLVAPVVRTLAVGTERALTNLREQLDRTARTLPGLDRPRLVVGSDVGGLERRTVGEAVRRREILLLPGARVDPDHAGTGDDVPIVRTATDLLRRTELRSLRLVDFATTYPQVDLSQPGDVVFSAAAADGPQAVVDHLGGAVVAYPARVLRCRLPRDRALVFTPEAVAADINAQPRDALDPKAWPLTIVPPDQITDLELLLTEVAGQRRALRSALADLEALVPAVTSAVGAHLCRLAAPEHSTSSPERIPA